MSSTQLADAHADLIDFHVASPVLPRSPCGSESNLPPEPDNLIDTDLPVFERTLRTAPTRARCSGFNFANPGVDVEDILISLEDDDDDAGERFLDLCSANGNDSCSPKANDLEALPVLKSLDATLEGSKEETAVDGDLNDVVGEGGDGDDARQVIEDCLEDLDNYLQAMDSDRASFSSDGRESTAGSRGSRRDELRRAEFDEELVRDKLRQIEMNYARFVASGVVNRAYVDAEGNAPQRQSRRPSSACAEPAEPSTETFPPRRPATVAAVRRERPQVSRRKSMGERDGDVDRVAWGTSRTSSDWSASADVTRERRAHASGERCTGTVVVEQPPFRQSKACSSSESAIHRLPDDPEGKREPPHGTRLRSPMRGLQELNGAGAEPVGAPSSRSEVPVTARPVSAPSRLPPSRSSTGRSSSRSRSRDSAVSLEPSGRARSSSASSRSRRPRSLSSSVSSLASSVESVAPPEATGNGGREAAAGAVNPRRPCDMPEVDSPLGKWPHGLSSMMACLGCTLGLFNISRFAVLSVHFGANFIFQFVLLSLAFGLPLFTLQLCLGQQLGAGVIDMWRISPLFQGVGVSLLIAQALTGLYSVVGVSWMFVFFRDSFVTSADRYRWAEPFLYYRNDIQAPINGTYKLTETIPDYFNGIVLQRYHLPVGTAYGTVKFQLAFNLAVVWMIVFVSLSKGLRSYGKVIFVFTLLPVFGTFVLCAKILGLMPPAYVNVIFPETSWEEFFLNSKSWLAAAQEAFLTWGLLGAAVMQIASHNKHKHLLQRDSGLVAVITVAVLLLVAFLANTCVQLLKSYGYVYFSSSFERMSSYQFLRSVRDPLPPNLANTPVRYVTHNSFIVGEKVARPGADFAQQSGYQVLRLATELLPATFAVVGADQLSPFWAVLAYFTLIMFGIGQQLAIWHCVITGIVAMRVRVLKSWETTITFFSCACGFVLGLPMATELGIYVVYFADYTVGGVWWLTIVILLQIGAVFVVRGRPYSGDTIVAALFNRRDDHPCLLGWAPTLLSFTWNVVLPVALMTLCVATFKNGSFRDMFVWHHAPSAEYWPLWARQAGSVAQLLPVLCVPLVAVVQSYRYLNNGPSDILERIQLLYRPPIGEHMEDPPTVPPPPPVTSSTNGNGGRSAEDPPPKYTPPPSYTTATGARLAKFLRRSVRRSVRRIASVLADGAGTSRNRAGVAALGLPPPPDYDAVFVEMNGSPSTLERLRRLRASPNALTAAEVASILRSSFRSGGAARRDVRGDGTAAASLSAERLVDAAAPIGETSLVLDRLSSLNERENKARNGSSSVI